MKSTITILGCGSSGGVPRVGQGWGACDPLEPRNRRRRCSILIDAAGEGDVPTTILVDTSPDLREQLLGSNTRYLDAVVITHEHADHTHGIDDLRPLTLSMRRRIDVYADHQTSVSFNRRFGYCFEAPPGSAYPPILNLKTVTSGLPFIVPGRAGMLEFETFPVTHGDMEVMGLRFRNVAYTPDISDVPDAAIPYLENLDFWIIDALRLTKHPAHFSLSDALTWIERMHPKRAILTNLHTDLDYGTLVKSLPHGVEVAFDGMCIELE